MWYEHSDGKISKVVYENNEGFILHVETSLGFRWVPFTWEDVQITDVDFATMEEAKKRLGDDDAFDLYF